MISGRWCAEMTIMATGRVRDLAAGGWPGYRGEARAAVTGRGGMRDWMAGGWAGREATGLCAAVALAGLVVLGAGGCASAASTRTADVAGATGTSCGEMRTAAGMAVTIKVVTGPVDCAAALRAEAAYAAAIKDGELRGNGGGAPLTVDGWTCESYPTPQALRTGDASACHTANAEVVAVLSLSSAAPSAPEAAGN